MNGSCETRVVHDETRIQSNTTHATKICQVRIAAEEIYFFLRALSISRLNDTLQKLLRCITKCCRCDSLIERHKNCRAVLSSGILAQSSSNGIWTNYIVRIKGNRSRICQDAPSDVCA